MEAGWWSRFAAFVGYDGACMETGGEEDAVAQAPGPICNALMLDDPDKDEQAQLRADLQEADFKVLSSAAWSQLVSWYGGGPEIRRPVLPQNRCCQPRLELFPLPLRLCKKGGRRGTTHRYVASFRHHDKATENIPASKSQSLRIFYARRQWSVCDLKFLLSSEVRDTACLAVNKNNRSMRRRRRRTREGKATTSPPEEKRRRG